LVSKPTTRLSMGTKIPPPPTPPTVPNAEPRKPDDGGDHYPPVEREVLGERERERESEPEIIQPGGTKSLHMDWVLSKNRAKRGLGSKLP